MKENKFGTPPKTYDENLQDSYGMLVDELHRTPKIFFLRRQFLQGLLYGYETAILFRKYEKEGSVFPFGLGPGESASFVIPINKDGNEKERSE
jgi:hypothetical protein